MRRLLGENQEGLGYETDSFRGECLEIRWVPLTWLLASGMLLAVRAQQEEFLLFAEPEANSHKQHDEV